MEASFKCEIRLGQKHAALRLAILNQVAIPHINGSLLKVATTEKKRLEQNQLLFLTALCKSSCNTLATSLSDARSSPFADFILALRNTSSNPPSGNKAAPHLLVNHLSHKRATLYPQRTVPGFTEIGSERNVGSGEGERLKMTRSSIYVEPDGKGMPSSCGGSRPSPRTASN